MAVIPQQFRCDCGCGKVRGVENHWYLVNTFSGPGFIVMPWDGSPKPERYQHAAGSECVHKLLNAWMEKQREGK